jgi:cytochrome b pre-mRNA-processing protein 3
MTPTKRVVNSALLRMLSPRYRPMLPGVLTLFKMFKKSAQNDLAHQLYVEIVNQARQPAFYTEHGVQDTPDGRFDLVILHAYLLFHRMKDDHQLTDDLSQAVFDLMFADMDQNLREMGLGDIGVSHRIKGMIKAFYGRVSVYDEGLDAPDDTRLTAALRRNLYRKFEPTDQQVAAIAQYMRRETENLSAQDIQDILNGKVRFGAAPETSEGAV